MYDTVVTADLAARLAHLAGERFRADVADVDPAEIPGRIGELVGQWATAVLAASTPDNRPEAAQQLAAALRSLAENTEDPTSFDLLPTPIKQLLAIVMVSPAGDPIAMRRPLTPLRDTVLMTNTRDQPAIGREIATEIESADGIDLVLAFIRWTGVRDLLAPLRRHVEAGKRLRVITTTYTGSTELRALQALVDLGAEVKVSYDTTTTRLHAKAWRFQRDSGFSTVYIGSSNLTFSAQVTGLEWNVRASQRLNPDLIDTFDRTFETYWADPHFEPFDAERFATAMAVEATDDSIATPFAVEPYPFQRQILEQLRVERRRGRPNSLVVAATGTGKTVIAALDYRQLRTELPRARLLFVAHRKEILEQSRTMFRHVLQDGSFGELWVDGQRPSQWEHVFASVQSLAAGDIEALDPAQFDVVIVDEFHHAAAKSYTTLLDRVTPTHLVGLTATPERADGLNILRWFGDRIAVELRLWDALEQGLLAPFHYYGIHDGTDLSTLTWRRGTGYDVNELADLYTGNTLWLSKVLASVHEKVGDATKMRALGFCVSIAHATFMAESFNTAGIAARVVTSDSTRLDREEAKRALEAGTVQILFTVDLYNEGVDIPAIDVVLMLRPTESATIFLQQLGRGLRRSHGKDVLTVLDFVGQQTKTFRFDLRYRRMLGRTRRQLEVDVQEDFPYLPAGSQLKLDPVAKEIILGNLKSALPSTWPQRVAELRELGDVPLATYLHETGLDLDDIYRSGKTWTALRRAADIDDRPAGPDEEPLARGLSRVLHVDNLDRIDRYAGLLQRQNAPADEDLSPDEARQLQGLLLTLLNVRKGTYRSLAEAAGQLWEHEPLRHELLEVLPILKEQVVHLHEPFSVTGVPLQTHATYTREEVLGAFGASSVSAPLPLQTGAYFHEPTNTDLFFITLQKTERDYSPTTRYRDYAISDALFHWETQATTSEASGMGQRYIHHAERGSNIALFIRSTKRDLSNRTMPYFCAGLATYVSHRSERPLQITWNLQSALPGDVFTAFRAAVV